ncbi:serine hydrolase domain-containing protein [Hymenobacter setariae]|nr:serine hydrolase domain-containing protein [Hymenobacter setariae]
MACCSLSMVLQRACLLLILAFPTITAAQHPLVRLTQAAHQAGHFNGAVLAARNGRVVAQVQQGDANLQFGVPITAATRFPIASMTKLFTAILTLQLVERGQLQLDTPAATYLPELPATCHAITIRQLLTHTSGLRNEPLQAYQAPYPTQDFVWRFVHLDSTRQAATFTYNNVDYIVLTRVLEVVTKHPYAALVAANIFAPLHMHDSGVVSEARIIPRLAYGYHNYSFGKGHPQDTLRNDRRYLSNYAGAGALYSTARDLYQLVQGLQAHTLLSAATSEAYLLQPQPGAPFLEYARGRSTLGSFFNDQTFATPVLERRGSIEGFNSVLLTSRDFTKVLIVLTNTDQADLEQLGDQLYQAF